MNVSAIIVTRGDVELSRITNEVWPLDFDEVIVWDNSKEERDLAVYGRYAAIERAQSELIYVQDDDVVLPLASKRALVDAYEIIATCPQHGPMKYGSLRGHWGWVCWHDDHDKTPFSPDAVACNQPERFRHEFYSDHALVGFGAVFHRDAPERAFDQFWEHHERPVVWGKFKRTCDIVFTALTPRILLDLPYEDLPWASHTTRMWKQPGHVEERARMHELVGRMA